MDKQTKSSQTSMAETIASPGNPHQKSNRQPTEKTEEIMATTKQCKGKCENKYQDETYGKNTRVMNTMKAGTLRCTVCKTVQ